MPLRRSNSYDLEIPATRWDTDSWYEPSNFNALLIGKRITNPDKRSAKETLLRRSLDLIRGRDENGEVCQEIFCKALRAALFGLAQEAVLTFSNDTHHELFQCCSDLLEYVAVYRHIEPDFVPRCEQRVLNAPPGIFEEMRSRALGYLGQYYFFAGRPETAARVWNAAMHRLEVDQVIVGMCETIVEKAPLQADLALSLAEIIQTPVERAKALTILSDHV